MKFLENIMTNFQRYQTSTGDMMYKVFFCYFAKFSKILGTFSVFVFWENVPSKLSCVLMKYMWHSAETIYKFFRLKSKINGKTFICKILNQYMHYNLSKKKPVKNAYFSTVSFRSLYTHSDADIARCVIFAWTVASKSYN